MFSIEKFIEKEKRQEEQAIRIFREYLSPALKRARPDVRADVPVVLSAVFLTAAQVCVRAMKGDRQKAAELYQSLLPGTTELVHWRASKRSGRKNRER